MLAMVLFAVLGTATTQAAQESIEVSRILVDVRVTDSGGALVTGLDAGAFTVTIDGKPMLVESATWVDDAPSAEPLRFEKAPGTVIPRDEIPLLAVPRTAPGRLVVFFVQTDFAREPSRVAGQMKFLPYSLQMLHGLQPADRVAVFSFDSHLKFRSDFTTDRAAAEAALRGTLAIDTPPRPATVPEPSLGPLLKSRTLRGVRDSEGALLVLANALKTIPGPKSLILLGWGLGYRTQQGKVRMPWRWKETREALEAARVTIFSIDTTYANAHDLEAGLIRAAEETGGIYVKTYDFASAAVIRVGHLMRGRYELELRSPVRLNAGSHPLEVRVERSGASVLAPLSVTIRD
jgi:VWFA-related protein